MFHANVRAALLGAALTIGAASAMAQGASPPGTAASQSPTAVGTTQKAAEDANRKAVPRTDTGTVVRTGPSAPDKARDAAAGMSSKDKSKAAAHTPRSAASKPAGSKPAMSAASKPDRS